MSQQPYLTVDPLSSPSSPAAQPSSTMTRFKSINVFKMIREYWLLLLLVAIVGAGVGAALFLYLDREQPRFRSQAALQLSAPIQDVYAPPAEAAEAAAGGVAQIQMRANTHASLMTAQHILQRVLEVRTVQDTPWYRGIAPGRRLQELRDAVRAWVPRQQAMIHVSVSTGHRESSQIILDELLRQYRADVQNQNRIRWQGMKDMLEADVTTLRRRVDEFEAAREEYALEHRISDVALGHETALQNRTRINDELHQYRGALSAAQGQLNMLRQQSETGFAAAIHPEVLAHPHILRMDEQVRQLRVTRDTQLLQLGPTHPNVKSVEQQISSLESARREKIAELTRERAEAQLQNVVSLIDRYRARVRELEPQFAAEDDRVRELSRRRASYEALVRAEERERERLMEVTAIQDAILLRERRPDHDGVRVAYWATPAEKVFPRWYIVTPLVALALVALVGGLVVLRELLDQRIRGTDDVRMLPNADLLGVLPDADDAPGRVREIENVVRTDPAGMLAESFRNLRTAINARLDRRGFKTLMLTSAQAASGTSAIVNNLASAWAFQGRKVLVIDANVRRPAMDRLFGVSGSVGLVDVLGGRASLDEAIVPVGDPDLEVLPAGNLNGTPPEIFERGEFRALLAEVESRYDVVLLDAAPALIASDAQLMARSVDAMVMVVRAVEDTRGMIARMLDLFEGQRADVLGVVLNGARRAKSGYFRESFREFTRYHRPIPQRKVNGAPGPRRAETASAAGDDGH